MSDTAHKSKDPGKRGRFTFIERCLVGPGARRWTLDSPDDSALVDRSYYGLALLHNRSRSMTIVGPPVMISSYDDFLDVLRWRIGELNTTLESVEFIAVSPAAGGTRRTAPAIP